MVDCVIWVSVGGSYGRIHEVVDAVAGVVVDGATVGAVGAGGAVVEARGKHGVDLGGVTEGVVSGGQRIGEDWSLYDRLGWKGLTYRQRYFSKLPGVRAWVKLYVCCAAATAASDKRAGTEKYMIADWEQKNARR
jgi:hypothetical protein